MSSYSSLFLPQPNPYSGLGGLNLFTPPYSGPLQWIAVQPRFEQFVRELALTPLQQRDGLRKRDGVVGCPNREYYGVASDTNNSFLIGSWGKNTAMRPATAVLDSAPITRASG